MDSTFIHSSPPMKLKVENSTLEICVILWLLNLEWKSRDRFVVVGGRTLHVLGFLGH